MLGFISYVKWHMSEEIIDMKAKKGLQAKIKCAGDLHYTNTF